MVERREAFQPRRRPTPRRLRSRPASARSCGWWASTRRRSTPSSPWPARAGCRSSPPSCRTAPTAASSHLAAAAGRAVDHARDRQVPLQARRHRAARSTRADFLARAPSCACSPRGSRSGAGARSGAGPCRRGSRPAGGAGALGDPAAARRPRRRGRLARRRRRQPAEAASFALSDRFLRRQPPPESTWPAELGERARPLPRRARGTRAPAARPAFGPRAAAPSRTLWPPTSGGSRLALALAEQDPQTEAVFLVLPGLREVSRRTFGGFTPCSSKAQHEPAPAAAAERLAAYYSHLDALLAEIWASGRGPAAARRGLALRGRSRRWPARALGADGAGPALGGEFAARRTASCCSTARGSAPERC